MHGTMDSPGLPPHYCARSLATVNEALADAVQFLTREKRLKNRERE
jgi:hypothetical protein